MSNNTALQELDCNDNALTILDVTKNQNLIKLFCSFNLFTSLDLKQNIALENLSCGTYELMNVDLSKNYNLVSLDCSESSKLSSLDLTQNPNLKYLRLVNNQLIDLDLSKNQKLEDFSFGINGNLKNLDLTKNTNLKFINISEAYGIVSLNLKNGNNNNVSFFLSHWNPNLFCIQVDNPEYCIANEWKKDDHSKFSADCSSTLATNEIQKSQIKIYPNPVKNILNIQTETKIRRLEIYSTTGQLVKTSFLNDTNVADLKQGIYIVKITTDKEVITEKFIKE